MMMLDDDGCSDDLCRVRVDLIKVIYGERYLIGSKLLTVQSKNALRAID